MESVPVPNRATLRQAFIIGVAAPGIITNLVAGAGSAKQARIDEGGIGFALVAVATAQSMESVKAPALTAQTLGDVVVNFKVAGAQQRNLPVEIKFLSGKREVLLATTTTLAYPFKGAIPTGAASIQVTAGIHSVSIPLSAGMPQPAVFTVNVTTEPTNDFWWALGSRRGGHISKLTLSPSSR